MTPSRYLADLSLPPLRSETCPCRSGMSLRAVIATDVERCRILAELDQGRVSAVAVVRALTFYPSLYGVVAYRLAHAARTCSSPAPVRLVLSLCAILLQRLLTPICGVEMSAQAHVGPGLFINHSQGVVVGSLEAGANLTLSHGTTLGRATGGGGTHGLECPVLGDRVWIGVNAVVAGAIRVGDDAAVGANAVVLKDVPDRGVAVGVPAEVTSRAGSFGNVVYRGMDADPSRAASLARVDVAVDIADDDMDAAAAEVRGDSADAA